MEIKEPKPDKPIRMTIVTPSTVHHKVRVAAAVEKLSVTAWALKAFEEKLRRDRPANWA